MRHHMLLAGSQQADTDTVYFEQDNSASNAGFTPNSYGSNVTSVTEGVSGDYYHWGHWSSDSNFAVRGFIVVVEPTVAKPISVGDTFKLTGDVEYYNTSAYHPDFERFSQRVTIRTYSTTPPDVTTITDSTQIFDSGNASFPHGTNINPPIGTLDEEFTIANGEDQGIRIEITFAIDELYDTGEPNFVNPYIGTQIKNIKLEVIGRA